MPNSAIPTFQEVMLPILKRLNNGNAWSSKTLFDIVSSDFKLTEEQKNQLLPSGTQKVFANRCLWAISYMKKANLLISPKRGVYQITERGKNAVNLESINEINIDFLSQYAEFQDFRKRKSINDSTLEAAADEKQELSDITPEEILDNAYQSIREQLESEILEKVYSQTPDFFERLVVDLLVKMGYGGSVSEAGRAVGKSGDEGIDGVIKEDRLGLDIIYIQAKKWSCDNVVGRPEIQKFVGALAGQGAKKGIFITTSRFTKEAVEYTPRNETKVVLIDGKKLAGLLIDFNLGVSTSITYEVKKIDNDYFGED